MSSRTLIPAIAALTVMMSTASLHAQTDIVWTGGAGTDSYDDALNWDLNIVPVNNGGTTYNVVLDTTGTVFFDVDLPSEVTDLTLGGSQIFRISRGHSLTVLDDAIINGTIRVQNSSFLATAPGATFGDDENATLIAEGGGIIAIAATNYSAAALPSTQTLLEAHGAGTLIDLASVQSFDDGFNAGGGTQIHFITASADAVIDCSGVQTIIAPFDPEDYLGITINSDADIDFSGVQEILTVSAGQVIFDLNVPSYSMLALLNATRTVFDLAEGTDLSLPLITSFGGSLIVPDGASVTMPLLNAFDGASLLVTSGGTLSAPNATTLLDSFIQVDGSQTYVLPSFVNINGSRFDISGGAMLAVAAPEYDTSMHPNPLTLIDLQGAGTVLDMSSVQVIDAGYNAGGGTQTHTIIVGTDATLDLSGTETIIGPFDPEDELHFIINGATLDLTSLSSTFGESAGPVHFELNVLAQSFPSLLLAYETIFDLVAGCALDLPVLLEFGGQMIVPPSASITMPALTSFDGASLEVQSGGTLSAPLAIAFENSFLSVEAAQILDIPQFASIDNSRFDISAGQTFGIAAAAWSTTDLVTTTLLLDARGVGTVVDFSTLQSLDVDFNGGGGAQIHTMTVRDGALFDGSNIESISLPFDPEDRLDVFCSNGATIDLSNVSLSSGTGGFELDVSGAGSLLDLTQYDTFGQSQSLALTGACQVNLAGLGVNSTGVFTADDDVSGFPAAHVDGSIRNSILDETLLRMGDLKLTMAADYSTFEAASLEEGAVTPSIDSFEVGELNYLPPVTLGPSAGCASAVVVFVDVFDNGNRVDSSTPEAVYVTGHDGFDGVQALNGGTLVLNGLNVYVRDAGNWLNLQSLVPPVGPVAYKDGFVANRIKETVGDFNGDQQVNAADLAALLGNWGTGHPIYDLTDNGIVDAADLAALLGSWGGCF